MIQVFRSVYEVSKDMENNKLELIYIASQRTNLFYMYPANSDFITVFKSFENPSYCKDILHQITITLNVDTGITK